MRVTRILLQGGLSQARLDLPIYFWEFNDYFENWSKLFESFREVGNEQQRKTLMSLDLKYPGKGYVKALENIISKHGDIATLAMKVHDNFITSLEIVQKADGQLLSRAEKEWVKKMCI